MGLRKDLHFHSDTQISHAVILINVVPFISTLKWVVFYHVFYGRFLCCIHQQNHLIRYITLLWFDQFLVGLCGFNVILLYLSSFASRELWRGIERICFLYFAHSLCSILRWIKGNGLAILHIFPIQTPNFPLEIINLT